jgi:predicted RNA-binding protein YlqC (UPF0109 family)
VSAEDVDSPAVDPDVVDPNAVDLDPGVSDEVDGVDEVDEDASTDAIGDDFDDDDDDDEVGADPNALPAANARSVLEYLVRSVVDDPDAVQISVSEGQRVTSLDVRVGDGDMGRVIGKRGRIAQAIRTVVRAAAVKDGIAVDIEFVD